MIYINLKGGLGNQMFEYAFALSLAERLNDEICLDMSGISNKTHNVYSLDHFNIGNVNVAKSSTLPKTKKMWLKIINSVLCRVDNKFGSKARYNIEKKFQKIFNRLGIYICADGYVKTYKTNSKIKYADGYFQSEKYFKNVSDEIKKVFTVKDEMLTKNQKIYNKINKTNSVCIHIRRGDYTKFSNHLVCTIDYYKKAMDIIKKKVKDAEFFIFSDDIPWVKENIKFKYDVNYVEGNNPNYEELRLMYSCKHFIISNSSFSWWAQYLSKNKDKVVVAPAKWFNNPKQRTDIMQDDWIKIKV